MDPQQLQIVLGQLAHAFGKPTNTTTTADSRSDAREACS